MRDSQFQLLVFDNGERLLFDLESDPEETADLSTSPEHQATFERLEASGRAIRGE